VSDAELVSTAAAAIAAVARWLRSYAEQAEADWAKATASA
jgi:hypothetical protein